MAKNKPYFIDGEKVPSVTQIISNNLGWNKNILIAWARREALNGNDPDKIRDKSAEIGTLTHKMVESHIKEIDLDLSEYDSEHVKKAEIGFISFLEWENINKPRYIESEVRLTEKNLKYGGTIDIISEINGQLGIIDLKTGNGVYPEHIIQLSAYDMLYKEDLSFWKILNLNKETGEFVSYEITKEQVESGMSIFKKLLDINNLKQQLTL